MNFAARSPIWYIQLLPQRCVQCIWKYHAQEDFEQHPGLQINFATRYSICFL